MNIMILSVGTRNKIVQYFKRTLLGVGNVIATDASPLAPALYEANRYYIVPRITEEGYIDKILDICKREQIKGIFSLIDPELSLLARNNNRFIEIGVTVIGSSIELCEMSLNKWKMYQWLSSHGYNCARSYIDKTRFYDDVELKKMFYPVFVKPIYGSASVSVSKVYDRETMETYWRHSKELMIQEFLDGQEIGADVYIDMISGNVVSIFTKKKIAMRAGETDKAVSFKDKKLFQLIEQFVIEAGYLGQIDIDIFEVGGDYYISEVNPRFGGGYPHAYECGCDHMKLIMNNLSGISNKKYIGAYEDDVYGMKFNEVVTRRKVNIL